MSTVTGRPGEVVWIGDVPIVTPRSRKGVLATAAINGKIIVAYHMGVAPDERRRMYGSRG